MKCTRACLVFAALMWPAAAHAQTRNVAHAGDTIVARAAADVPENAVRRLAPDWKASIDNTAIGDIAGMAVAPDGRIYIWDPATPALWSLSADGQSLARIGRRGAGPGEYARVNGIAVMKNGDLVAWDEGNARVNFYDRDGKFLRSAVIPYTFCCPNNVVTADTLNRVWLFFGSGLIAQGSPKTFPPVTDRRSAFLVLDANGAIRDTIEAPPLRREFEPLTARSASSISSLVMPYGGMPRYVASPLGHVVSGTGRPYVVQSANTGRSVRIEGAVAPVMVGREERSQLRANLEASLRRTQPDWQWGGSDIPSEKPPYFDLRVGQDGRIWVALSVASESFVPDPFARGSQAALPPITFRSKEKRWDVFAPDGAFVARVAAPRTFAAYVMRGNTVWGVLRDADDVPTVVRMKF